MAIILQPNQLYTLRVVTPYGAEAWQWTTRCQPFYSNYSLLLEDIGLSAQEVPKAQGIRAIYLASLLCDDILLRDGQTVPETPTFAMQQYVRYRAAFDVLRGLSRRLLPRGRTVEARRLGELTIEQRGALTASEFNLLYRDLEKQVRHWEQLLKTNSRGIGWAVKAGQSYPYPLPTRVL